MRSAPGVYILVTAGPKSKEFEYRIGFIAYDISVLFADGQGRRHEKGYLNPIWAKFFFGESTVFTDEDSAYAAADKLLKEKANEHNFIPFEMEVLPKQDCRFPGNT